MISFALSFVFHRLALAGSNPNDVGKMEFSGSGRLSSSTGEMDVSGSSGHLSSAGRIMSDDRADGDDDEDDSIRSTNEVMVEFSHHPAVRNMIQKLSLSPTMESKTNAGGSQVGTVYDPEFAKPVSVATPAAVSREKSPTGRVIKRDETHRKGYDRVFSNFISILRNST